MPVITLPNREDWPQELRDQLTEGESGGFSLNVVPKTRLDEFRQTNIDTSRERDDLKSKLDAYIKALGDEFDPETFETEFEQLKQIAQRVADGELTESTDIEKRVEDRVKKMREDLEGQNRAMAQRAKDADARAAEAEKRFQNSVLERAVYDAVLDPETGANPEALSYIVADATRVFRFDEDGEMIPKKGEATIYGSDGATPMSMKEWVTEHVSNNRLLAKPSAGGGNSPDPTKKHLGLSEDEYRKMTPMQKLAAANKNTTARR
ncbi:hypothetical protein [Candidatus Macondimonas diazotrophica]|jgi:gas vesicle protein|uniref:Phage protein n=1 Tax=Candidatus Macondimonas diazotrophica TaxID=2305248 RepID=A0A4Z0F823_9GAMM|nr:hypothetical protein [Candidatus Macondimonas diazotrophica]TFZ81602.1 hypothetical protein E4680_11920 [Candidatus Macondimonas diazotrophica]